MNQRESRGINDDNWEKGLITSNDVQKVAYVCIPFVRNRLASMIQNNLLILNQTTVFGII